jgi:hypothetical protein
MLREYLDRSWLWVDDVVFGLTGTAVNKLPSKRRGIV